MRLIERVFARNLRNYVDTCRELGLGADIDSLDVSDGVAAFFGIGSPLTTVKGLPGNATVDQVGGFEAFFRAHGVPVSTVELAPWSDTATQELLAARGYVISDTEDVVICTRGDEGVGPASASLEVMRISPDAFIEIARHGFRDTVDPVVDELLGVAARLRGSIRLGVRTGGRVIACAQAVSEDEAVIFGNDNTLPDARRLGAQTALIRARLARVGEGTIAIAEVVPASGSERNYIRCGFEVVYTRTHYCRALD